MALPSVAAKAPQANSKESPGKKGVTTKPVSQNTTAKIQNILHL